MKTYRIDGTKVASKSGFFTEIGRAVNGDGGYFGSNLDALADCLRGGFGTPEDRKFRFVMTSYRNIRNALGEETWNTVLSIITAEGVDLWLES
ncbi:MULTISPECIES: barstar family protein [unclassified Mycolicibacterium]|uniref:barstar family protein n=1 Tax=unclassified Mycolicibacterium TaxID=2636767 RepID=UPI00130BBD54|nr:MULTISPECIES: barstar family protein [unclassified Mycolicibacterium]MUL82768.1 ribonuclease inhibitor [Mycolicibacterium sp. CBMA 329]MUL89103.1 ribonuclease inhibitor [Mycolicibacterium sp. CBMA 331]MUL97670.1 ribonuclease inhibitor [Mycolicibacterium sp. CBMA 334]MUM28656.1 ribonuclease inhibitor [Mycolicibacterium sp. CBMA 295]MUM38619.1 ribonuclease inhibitor [Mycolicibacterium sp. CBMA 247]